MKSITETEMYEEFSRNLQISFQTNAMAFLRTDLILRFQHPVDIGLTSNACEYMALAADFFIRDSVESVRRKCGIEPLDDAKIKAVEDASNYYGRDTYHGVPVDYIEVMYRKICLEAPQVLDPDWRSAYEAGVKDGQKEAAKRVLNSQFGTKRIFKEDQ